MKKDVHGLLDIIIQQLGLFSIAHSETIAENSSLLSWYEKCPQFSKTVSLLFGRSS